MSTGNTPPNTDVTNNLDTYQPIMEIEPITTAELNHTAEPPSTQTPPYNLLVHIAAAPIKKLTYRDVRSWRLFIEQLRLPHAELRTAVSQAAKLISGQLDGINGVEVEAMASGMPNATVPWTEVGSMDTEMMEKARC